jgi:hypothetical protein
MTESQKRVGRDAVWDPASDAPPAHQPRERGPVADVILHICGLVAMASPLAAWIAWTQTILVTVFVTALTCILICWLIVSFDPED